MKIHKKFNNDNNLYHYKNVYPPTYYQVWDYNAKDKDFYGDKY